METLRLWITLAWIALPTVMFGGYSLLGLLNRNQLTPFQLSNFRAGHAHAGVLLVMSLLYYSFLDQTGLSTGLKQAAASVLLLGVLAQSGGFFLHMAVGKPGAPSAGTRLTVAGAVLLALAIAVLVYGLLTMP